MYIVDDSSLLRKELVLTNPWDKWNCVVVGQAGDGETALKEIPDIMPDIVITDIKMASLTGLQLIEALKEKGVGSEFIVISAYGEFEYAQNAIKLQVQNYILKPINDEEMEMTIKKTIKNIESKRSLERKEAYGTKLASNNIDLMEDFDVKNLNAFLRKAIEYVTDNYKLNISLKDVAGELHISESYLGKLFKTEINTTFVEFLTQVRIRKALELLKDKLIPIYQVAEEVGYSDYRYFSLVFKKITGVNPKEFQKRS
ncbi:response regulator transcription factor [Clostridium polynesiense]|uniref:response regulator transcription factor n=1 Tax=Clostridium polynesiense TaxID=1325933 RepID=UPI001FA792BC|nr:helix-turn-helix domain-containing protein [Clostridium polynesiense]